MNRCTRVSAFNEAISCSCSESKQFTTTFESSLRLRTVCRLNAFRSSRKDSFRAFRPNQGKESRSLCWLFPFGCFCRKSADYIWDVYRNAEWSEFRVAARLLAKRACCWELEYCLMKCLSILLSLEAHSLPFFAKFKLWHMCQDNYVYRHTRLSLFSAVVTCAELVAILLGEQWDKAS